MRSFVDFPLDRSWVSILKIKRRISLTVLVSSLIVTGCIDENARPDEPTSSDVGKDYKHQIEASEYEATLSAECLINQEREAWSSHLVDLFALGQNYAGDPTATEDPENVNCEDFDFQGEAEAFFLGAGGAGSDVFVLDEDEDGVACELLPDWYPGSDWSTSIKLP